MSSINTNASAMTALQALKMTNKALESTQSAISTGLSVNSASDNAAYWSIATTMRSDNDALSTVQDALGLGAATVDTAYTGLDSAIDVTSEIKKKLVAASEPGIDKTKINSEISQLKQQLSSIVESASFSGENWLLNDAATAAADKSVVASFNRASTGNVSVTTIDITISDFTLIGSGNSQLGLLTQDVDANAIDDTYTGTAADNWFLIDGGATGTAAATGTEIGLTASTTDAEVNAMIRVVDAIISDMTSAAADLGATKTRIDLQNDFVGNLMDAIDRGVGQLVDADMNEESTKLQALQVQQQLGIQALSIANSNSQNILSLFR